MNNVSIEKLVSISIQSSRSIAKVAVGMFELLEGKPEGISFTEFMTKQAEGYYGTCDLSEVMALQDEELYKECLEAGMREVPFNRGDLLKEGKKAFDRGIVDEEGLVKLAIENPEEYTQSLQALLAILSGDEQKLRGIMVEANTLGMEIAEGTPPEDEESASSDMELQLEKLLTEVH